MMEAKAKLHTLCNKKNMFYNNTLNKKKLNLRCVPAQKVFVRRFYPISIPIAQRISQA